MKSILRLVASATLSLMLVTGIGVSLTGCSADSLSGPNIEALASEETGGGTTGGGSEHNLDKSEETGGGTTGGGSEHNLDN